MPLLKLKTGGGGQAQSQSHHDGSAASPSAGSADRTAASPAPSIASVAPRLKLKASAPPTPATEVPGPLLGAAAGQTKKQSAQRKTGGGAPSKKRTANDDLSPAAKRIAKESQAARRPSLKVKPPTRTAGHTLATPGAAGKFKIAGPKKQTATKIKALTNHTAKHPVPPREHGVGYDSEDSEQEVDPAIQQGLILRMQPGEDADLLRAAIAEGRIGSNEKSGVEASIRFVTADLKRALIKVRGHMYAAALVDLPCIVESMKSWDKKGWWKVADICQMLLVLGPVQNETQVREYPLPREVNKETMQYAHGLTPPMHYVRKRRFRKRVSHRQMENVEEEVERLLREDDEWERNHGKVTHNEYTLAELDQMQRAPVAQSEYGEEMDAEGEPVDTVEGYDSNYVQTPEQAEDFGGDLEADLAEAMADEDAPEPSVAELITESPAPMADQATSFSAVEHAMAETPIGSPAATLAGDVQEQMTQDEESDEDESDYDDEESPDVVDEDAAQKAAEKAQQLEEVADLEREIAAVRTKANSMANQLLKKREMDKLAKLEGDLKMKRAAFGLDAEE